MIIIYCIFMMCIAYIMLYYCILTCSIPKGYITCYGFLESEINEMKQEGHVIHNNLPEGHNCLYTYQERWAGIEFTRTPLFYKQ
jgi:hypothetical protein